MKHTKTQNIFTVNHLGVPAESNHRGYRDTNATHSCHSGAGSEKHVKTDGDVVDCKFFAFQSIIDFSLFTTDWGKNVFLI